MTKVGEPNFAFNGHGHHDPYDHDYFDYLPIHQTNGSNITNCIPRGNVSGETGAATTLKYTYNQPRLILDRTRALQSKQLLLQKRNARILNIDTTDGGDDDINMAHNLSSLCNCEPILSSSEQAARGVLVNRRHAINLAKRTFLSTTSHLSDKVNRNTPNGLTGKKYGTPSFASSKIRIADEKENYATRRASYLIATTGKYLEPYYYPHFLPFENRAINRDAKNDNTYHHACSRDINLPTSIFNCPALSKTLLPTQNLEHNLISKSESSTMTTLSHDGYLKTTVTYTINNHYPNSPYPTISKQLDNNHPRIPSDNFLPINPKQNTPFEYKRFDKQPIIYDQLIDKYENTNNLGLPRRKKSHSQLTLSPHVKSSLLDLIQYSGNDNNHNESPSQSSFTFDFDTSPTSCASKKHKSRSLLHLNDQTKPLICAKIPNNAPSGHTTNTNKLIVSNWGAGHKMVRALKEKLSNFLPASSNMADNAIHQKEENHHNNNSVSNILSERSVNLKDNQIVASKPVNWENGNSGNNLKLANHDSDKDITGQTFGKTLEEALSSITNSLVPSIVTECVRIIETHGLRHVGIYRIPGNNTVVTELLKALDKRCPRADTSDQYIVWGDKRLWRDVNVVASILKTYFRRLKDPLLTNDLYRPIIESNRLAILDERLITFKKFIHILPVHHYHTLKYFIKHLNTIASNSHHNRMNPKNLAIVFGPTLVRLSNGDNDIGTFVKDMPDQCKIVETLINHCAWFFDETNPKLDIPYSGNIDIANALVINSRPKDQKISDGIAESDPSFFPIIESSPLHNDCALFPNITKNSSNQSPKSTTTNENDSGFGTLSYRGNRINRSKTADVRELTRPKLFTRDLLLNQNGPVNRGHTISNVLNSSSEIIQKQHERDLFSYYNPKQSFNPLNLRNNHLHSRYISKSYASKLENTSGSSSGREESRQGDNTSDSSSLGQNLDPLKSINPSKHFQQLPFNPSSSAKVSQQPRLARHLKQHHFYHNNKISDTPIYPFENRLKPKINGGGSCKISRRHTVIGLTDIRTDVADWLKYTKSELRRRRPSKRRHLYPSFDQMSSPTYLEIIDKGFNGAKLRVNLIKTVLSNKYYAESAV
ncbi:unnamed protein product [Gordionus sp. m RMFG-2023]|uniref:uncharacterized protein LOC135929182 isoform X2 n=1 Tax=Gordionus sp. m RMFG-2023 TaxID=3053472 RepID=UPI0030E1FB15